MHVVLVNDCKPHRQGCFVQGAQLKNKRADKKVKPRYKPVRLHHEDTSE